MNWRPNTLNSLNNNFAQGSPSIDELPKLWPNLGEKLGNPDYYENDEVVPSTNRSISSSHFNNIADSIAAVQHYISSNVGKAFVIESSGVTSCGTGAALAGTTLIASPSGSSYYYGQDIIMSHTDTVTAQISLTMGSTGDAYCWTTTGTIPSAFGANPWNARSFGVFCTIQLEPTGLIKGVMESKDSSFYYHNYLKILNKYPQLLSSVTPVSGDPDAYKLHVRSINFESGTGIVDRRIMFTPSISFPVDFSNLEKMGWKEIIENPTTERIFHFSGRESALTSDPPIDPLEPRTNSLKFVGALCWANSPKTRGGLIVPSEMAGVKERNVGIEFMWHGTTDPWTQTPFYDTSALGTFARQALVNLWSHAGAFLRVKKMSSPRASLISGQAPRTQYEGYVLRFHSQLPSAHTQTASSWNTLYGDYLNYWSILKVRYETWEHGMSKWSGSTFLSTSSVGDYWGSEDTFNDGLTSGGWYYCAQNLSQFQVIASGQLGFDPVISKTSPSSGGYPFLKDDNDRYMFRFEAIDDTLYLYSRSIDVETWTLVGSGVDADPIYPDNNTEYYSSGFFSKPVHYGDNLTLYNQVNPYAWIYFSNVSGYYFGEGTTAGSTVNARAILTFFKIGSSDNVPGMT